jgi:hypothetical protein
VRTEAEESSVNLQYNALAQPKIFTTSYDGALFDPNFWNVDFTQDVIRFGVSNSTKDSIIVSQPKRERDDSYSDFDSFWNRNQSFMGI